MNEKKRKEEILSPAQIKIIKIEAKNSAFICFFNFFPFLYWGCFEFLK